MAEDKTLRLIIGILLVLVSLPILTMGTMMMGGFGYSWPGALLSYAVGIGLLILGIYLIKDGLEKK